MQTNLASRSERADEEGLTGVLSHSSLLNQSLLSQDDIYTPYCTIFFIASERRVAKSNDLMPSR